MSHTVSRQQVIHCLCEEWGKYRTRFESLPPAEQAAFLQGQGYATFHDLLAHICAWWEEGLKVIHSILENEEQPRREYDIDTFNANAIEHFRPWSQEDLFFHFENLRQTLLALVSELPEDAFSHRRIASWLNAVVLEHAAEHKITTILHF